MNAESIVFILYLVSTTASGTRTVPLDDKVYRTQAACEDDAQYLDKTMGWLNAPGEKVSHVCKVARFDARAK
jgi:hypothetical protein